MTPSTKTHAPAAVATASAHPHAAPPDVRREIIAGLTVFLAMCYIIAVNPLILGTNGSDMPFAGVATATVLTGAVMSLLMAAIARLPLGVAPGMGLNSFVAVTIIIGGQIPWPTALGICFWAGILHLIIVATPLREAVIKALPPSLRIGAVAGIGCYLAFVGLRNGGFAVVDYSTMQHSSFAAIPFLLAMAGFTLILFLMRHRSPFAFIAGMALATVGALVFGLTKIPSSIVSSPDFSSTFLKLDLSGALKFDYLDEMVAIVLTSLLDSLAFMMGAPFDQSLRNNDGRVKRLGAALVVNAMATPVAALFGSSPGVIYFENIPGLKMGARSWIPAAVVGLCFIPFFFCAPLIGVVAPSASVAVLLMIGTLMFEEVRKLPHGHHEDWAPAFISIIFMVATGSISDGLMWGLVSHTGLHLLAARWKDVTPTAIGMAVLATILLVVKHR